MWKLHTSSISDQLYDFLEKEKVLPEKQKGCKGNTRGKKDQLLTEKTVLRDFMKRHTNLSLGWMTIGNHTI